jgi:hypothetical protein
VRRLAPLSCLLFVACRSSQAEEHLQRELAFFVPYVDIEAEEKAVRNVLGQRKLVVDKVVRKPGFVALSASTLDGVKSAVRVITPRGVVLGEDGDTQDYFGLAAVELFAIEPPGAASDTLLGIVKTARNQSAGCAQLLRVLPDGRTLQVPVHIEQFGERVCLHALQARGPDTYAATLAWPSLSPFSAPTLEVDLVRQTGRLDRPDDPSLGLRVETGGEWVQRATDRLSQPLPSSAQFSERHARGVAQAALALAVGRPSDAQLGAYRSALGRVLPGSPEAEIVAVTTTHIENGWLDAIAPAEAADPPIDPDSVVVEPER